MDFSGHMYLNIFLGRQEKQTVSYEQNVRIYMCSTSGSVLELDQAAAEDGRLLQNSSEVWAGYMLKHAPCNLQDFEVCIWFSPINES